MIGYAHAERGEQARRKPILPIGAGMEQEGDRCNPAEEGAGLPGQFAG